MSAIQCGKCGVACESRTYETSFCDVCSFAGLRAIADEAMFPRPHTRCPCGDCRATIDGLYRNLEQAEQAKRDILAAASAREDELLERIADAEKERDENDGAFKCWRRRCEQAEKQLDNVVACFADAEAKVARLENVIASASDHATTK
mgnify:FL=1